MSVISDKYSCIPYAPEILEKPIREEQVCADGKSHYQHCEHDSIYTCWLKDPHMAHQLFMTYTLQLTNSSIINN